MAGKMITKRRRDRRRRRHAAGGINKMGVRVAPVTKREYIEQLGGKQELRITSRIHRDKVG